MWFSVVLGMKPWGSYYHTCWTSWKYARNPLLGKFTGSLKALGMLGTKGTGRVGSISQIYVILLKLN
jgi:hypothetical protein